MKKGLLFVFFLLIIASCARKGSPTGGPKDLLPPRFLKANPDTLSTNVSNSLKEIIIEFDEYIVLKEAIKQIIISPTPQKNPIITPSFSSPRKYIRILFQDSLKDNTTYNINFGESIQDNNEGNKLSLFSYVFSTGEYIDSLSIKGKINDISSDKINLKTLVALYKKDTIDNYFVNKPYYIGKIDSLGNYNLKYLHEGTYEIFAFTDENFNLRYDENENESVGFIDHSINLNMNIEQDLILSKNRKTYTIDKSTQVSQGKILLELNGNPELLTITPLNTEFPKDYFFVHKKYSDSAYITFNDKYLNTDENKQRLSFEVKNSDKLDTVSVLYNLKEKTDLIINKDKDELVKGDLINFSTNNTILAINKDLIKISKDTVSLDFRLKEDSLLKNKFALDFPIDFESQYNITLYPNAVTDILEQTHDTLSYKFKTKKQNEYGNLIVQLTNIPSKPFFFQLISKDKVIKTEYGNKSKYEFKYLNPGEYYFKILVDENDNGIWDTGDYRLKKQPEKTYLYKQIVLVRAFWDINENWKIE